MAWSGTAVVCPSLSWEGNTPTNGAWLALHTSIPNMNWGFAQCEGVGWLVCLEPWRRGYQYPNPLPRHPRQSRFKLSVISPQDILVRPSLGPEPGLCRSDTGLSHGIPVRFSLARCGGKMELIICVHAKVKSESLLSLHRDLTASFFATFAAITRSCHNGHQQR